MTAPRRSTSTVVLLVLLLVAGIGAGAIVAELILSHGTAAPKVAGNPAATVGTSTASGQVAMSPSAIYKQAAPGVVMITTQGNQFRQSGGATGSGIVLNKNGDILTNAHVIKGADQLQVTFEDGSVVNATVVSANTSTDLATIRVSVDASRLHPLTLGSSDTVLVGDTVYAIGAPFGHAESMSAGVVSGLNRTDESTGLHGLIQHSARINPGNSGGPLLNTLGQVIGINVAIQSPINGSVGVGFAIPINSARSSSSSGL